MNYQQSWRDKKRTLNRGINTQRQISHRKTHHKFPFLSKRKIIKFSLILAALFFVIILITISWLSRGLPKPGQLLEREVIQSTKIYDRTGENILYDIHGDEQRTLVKLENIPNHVKWAAIAIEDKTFYEHGGISIWGILRGVVWQTIRGKRTQGGSTLTQQFVKNAILTSERKVTRKIKEWILSYKLEKVFSKDEILQMYLNEIPYGSTAYGVEAASRRYFNKGVADITIAEAAILAALPQAPTYFSPYGSNKDKLIIRQQYVITLMQEQGYITEEEAREAKEQELIFAEPATNITAPHFVMYVKEILTQKYGEKTVEQGGLKIYTTLDLYKQKIAEEVVKKQAEINQTNYEASNASLVSIDPKTGEILAMVGSKDYFNDEIDGQVNIATSPRQPGSSLKPLIYATMFTKGYTPNTILYDVVTNFATEDGKTYEPKNYNLKEYGPISIRKALAGSLNIPAVKGIYLAGIDNVLEIAEKVGYTTLKDKDRFGLSLVLGGAEVSLLEHTNAYSAYAREGEINPVVAILRVEDNNGNILEEKDDSDPKKALETESARMINSILSDNKAREYAFGTRSWLTLGSRPVAAKTGTTNDYRDAWTIGYTPSLVTGVWVGNNDNSEMKRGAAGGVVAAPIWNAYMKQVLGDTPVETFKQANIPMTGKAILDGGVGVENIVKIDSSTGLLATEYTPEDLIKEVVFKEHHSILYYIDKNDPLGDAPKNPSNDPQFKLWEDRVLAWAQKELENSTSTINFSTSTVPTEYDNVHTPENKPNVSIIKPFNNETLTNKMLSTEIKATAKRGIAQVNYYINNYLFLTKNGSSFFNLNNQSIDFLNDGFYNLKVEACDDVKNCSADSIEFNLASNTNTPNKPFSISIVSPNSGLALTDIDFPLTIQLQITNPEQISHLELININNDKVSILKNISPVDNSYLNITLDNILEEGTQTLSAKAYGWNGQIKSSQTITASVSRIE